MRRGLYKTRAVVLNSFDYGESDRIVAFYTEDFGKIKGMAKGARRSRKRFGVAEVCGCGCQRPSRRALIG